MRDEILIVLIIVLTVALVGVPMQIAYGAEPECNKEGGRIFCPADRWQTLRDKARLAEILCSQLDTLPDLPDRLAGLCEEPSGASRIWARAERYREAEKRAREIQRKLNVRSGRIGELERQDAEKARRIEELSGEVELQTQRAETRKWLAVSAGGLAALLGGLVVADSYDVLDI